MHHTAVNYDDMTEGQFLVDNLQFWNAAFDFWHAEFMRSSFDTPAEEYAKGRLANAIRNCHENEEALRNLITLA